MEDENKDSLFQASGKMTVSSMDFIKMINQIDKRFERIENLLINLNDKKEDSNNNNKIEGDPSELKGIFNMILGEITKDLGKVNK